VKSCYYFCILCECKEITFIASSDRTLYVLDAYVPLSTCSRKKVFIAITNKNLFFLVKMKKWRKKLWQNVKWEWLILIDIYCAVIIALFLLLLNTHTLVIFWCAHVNASLIKVFISFDKEKVKMIKNYIILVVSAPHYSNIADRTSNPP
jgi:hypothetical protein